MNDSMDDDVLRLLILARQGDTEALGELIQLYGGYLTLLARLQLDGRLAGMVDASDLVQETFLEAQRDFGDFRGTTEAELVSWLWRILASNLVDVARRFTKTQARDVSLERAFQPDIG